MANEHADLAGPRIAGRRRAAPWVLVHTTMNWWERMQWPLVPVLAFTLAGTSLRQAYSAVDGAVAVSWKLLPSLALVFGMCLPAVNGLERGHGDDWFHASVATALRGVDTTGVRVATSEAGLIPLAVTRPSLDTYGYNNRRIAETAGAALNEQLSLLRPNVLIVHGRLPVEFVPTLPQCDFGSDLPRWDAMVDELYTYARTSGFTLLRSSRTGYCDAWSVFIRPDTPRPVVDALANYPAQGEELAGS